MLSIFMKVSVNEGREVINNTTRYHHMNFQNENSSLLESRLAPLFGKDIIIISLLSLSFIFCIFYYNKQRNDPIFQVLLTILVCLANR